MIAQALLEKFGHATFRPGQEEIIAAVMAGDSVVAVMPTGAGKSLCYQLPAVVLDGVTIVVSPLIALMKDQVDSLSARAIAATYINSTLNRPERLRRTQAVLAGHYRIVYVAPERFRDPEFIDQLVQVRPQLFAVDEAHCISQWGHDFRPDYARLGEVVRRLGAPRLLALTATATPEVQDDICVQLGIEEPRIFVRGFDRENLFLEVVECHGKRAKLEQLEILLADYRGPAIVYCSTRRATEEVAAHLGPRRAAAYHAGLAPAVRREVQDRFMGGATPIVAATNAFGMGVDKADIGRIIHYGIPRTLEAYYQEIGRAGRDGKPARCTLLFAYEDVRTQRFLLDSNYPAPYLIRQVWEATRQVAGGADWVRREAVRERCGPLLTDRAFEAALIQLERADNLRRTPTTPPGLAIRSGNRLRVDFLALRQRYEQERRKLQRMVDYAHSRRCRRTVLLGYFGDREPARCPACDRCCGTATEQPLADLRPRVRHPRTTRPPQLPATLTETDRVLLERLRQVRRRLAQAQGVPAFVVFHDRTLREMAQRRPRTAEELLSVRGVGEAKMERYGCAFLAALQETVEVDTLPAAR